VPLPVVDDESLGVWLFGPGTGELVVVRAPPGVWLVVDGCAADRAGYAQQLLDHYGARPSLVVMTHPHADHASGLRQVIERATAGSVELWPRLGMVPAPYDGGAGDTWDAFASLTGGVAEQVVATIIARWSRHPACRWDLEVGSSERLGEAAVRVLSPTSTERDAAAAAWSRGKTHDFNRAATALLVNWAGHRVLLGSDLVEHPGAGWTKACSHDAKLSAHDVYKVAHHGSEGALGPQIAKPSRPMLRTWVCTPFASKGLPKARDDGGLDRLLALEDQVLLTGLPLAYAEQGDSTKDVRRAELRDSPEAVFTPGPPGFPDCWVHLRPSVDTQNRPSMIT
jgi:hypothetical protein